MAREVLALAMDAGGTMTDTFIVDRDGNFVIGKAPTTPWDESEGFIESSQDAFQQWGVDERAAFSQFEIAVYAGTTMLNTLLTRTGRRIGLITSKGFEDILVMEQGRQVWSGYSYADRLHSATHVHNKPLVPRRAVRGVSERTTCSARSRSRSTSATRNEPPRSSSSSICRHRDLLSVQLRESPERAAHGSDRARGDARQRCRPADLSLLAHPAGDPREPARECDDDRSLRGGSGAEAAPQRGRRRSEPRFPQADDRRCCPTAVSATSATRACTRR